MKLCLIGTGTSASNIAKAIKKIRNSEIIAVCGSSLEHVKNFARKNKIQKHYTSIQEMFIEEKSIQGAIIATIPSRHYQEIILSSDYVDFVIVEKPIVTTAEQVIEIKKLIQKKEISISVIYQMRYSRAYNKLKNEIEKHLHEINYINLQMSHYRGDEYFSKHGSWRKNLVASGGGVLLQQGIHWINFLCSVVGYNIKVISVKKFFKEGIETENTLIANLLLNNKTKFDLFVSRSSPTIPTTIKIYGDELFYCLNDYKFSKVLSTKDFFHKVLSILSRKFPILFKIMLNSYSGTYKDFLNDAINKNLGKNKQSLFLNDALNDVNLINKIYQ
jgi:predicted dehydrogenase